MNATTLTLANDMRPPKDIGPLEMLGLASGRVVTIVWGVISASALASVAAAPQTPAASPWLVANDFPVSNVMWDNLSRAQHPTMQSTEVKNFQLAMFNADLDALRQIYDIVLRNFADVPGMTWSYRQSKDLETLQPQLFLRVDTNGMDLDEQMRRELVMRETIANDPRLVAAKQYHVISVV